MLKYIVKRILIIIPTLFVISLITFLISAAAPGDPVKQLLSSNNNGAGQSASGNVADDKAYIEIRHKLGLDLPLFYFSVSNATYCDTLHRVPKPAHREALERLSFNYGSWERVSSYFLVNKQLLAKFNEVKKTRENAKAIAIGKNSVFTLLETHDEKKIRNLYEKIAAVLKDEKSLTDVQSLFKASEARFNDMVQYTEQQPLYSTGKLLWLQKPISSLDVWRPPLV